MFDTHAHLTDLKETRDVDALLRRAQGAGVMHIVNISTHPEELVAGLELSKRYPWVYNAGALPPHDANDPNAQEFLNQIFAIARREKLIAIGECGLDYYHPGYDKKKQIEIFFPQIQLSKELHLPLLIHCRNAFEDLLEILDREKAARVLIHCFSGNEEEAKNCLERGYFLGISGIVTFKKSHALQEIVKKAPLDQLLLETDAPYLAPEGHRGKPNESSLIIEVARKLSEIRNIPLNELIEKTTQNALSFFRA